MNNPVGKGGRKEGGKELRKDGRKQQARKRNEPKAGSKKEPPRPRRLWPPARAAPVPPYVRHSRAVPAVDSALLTPPIETPLTALSARVSERASHSV